jgi:hypothetical protein
MYVCSQVGSIVPDNAPVVMGMPDTFFDDDTLVQRIVNAAAAGILRPNLTFIRWTSSGTAQKSSPEYSESALNNEVRYPVLEGTFHAILFYGCRHRIIHLSCQES